MFSLMITSPTLDMENC